MAGSQGRAPNVPLALSTEQGQSVLLETSQVQSAWKGQAVFIDAGDIAHSALKSDLEGEKRLRRAAWVLHVLTDPDIMERKKNKSGQERIHFVGQLRASDDSPVEKLVVVTRPQAGSLKLETWFVEE